MGGWQTWFLSAGPLLAHRRPLSDVCPGASFESWMHSWGRRWGFTHRLRLAPSSTWASRQLSDQLHLTVSLTKHFTLNWPDVSFSHTDYATAAYSRDASDASGHLRACCALVDKPWPFLGGHSHSSLLGLECLPACLQVTVHTHPFSFSQQSRGTGRQMVAFTVSEQTSSEAQRLR